MDRWIPSGYDERSHGFSMALIEIDIYIYIIDGLPNFKMVIFHGYVK